MYTVYAIYNRKFDKIYIGQTRNLAERLSLHKSKTFTGYTARYGGTWILLYHEQSATRQDALKREKQLKSYQGRLFIKQLINRE